MALYILTNVPKVVIIIVTVMSMNLKEYRNSLNITIKEASSLCSIPIRTYLRYEKDEEYGSKFKRDAIYNLLKINFEKLEKNRVLSVNIIVEKCKTVFDAYGNDIEYCYLFGSYAKGYAKEDSDVDLCISTNLTGLNFIGLIEELQNALHKEVDLLRISDMKDNFELINEIMKGGIKIYG